MTCAASGFSLGNDSERHLSEGGVNTVHMQQLTGSQRLFLLPSDAPCRRTLAGCLLRQLGHGWHSSLLLLEPCSSLGCQLPPAASAQGDVNQKVPTELLADRHRQHSCCHPVTLSACHPCAADTPLSAAAACAVGSKSLTERLHFRYGTRS